MSPQNLFRRIVAIDNLRSAWIKAKQYARTEEFYFDAYAYSAFEERVEASLAALHHELLSNTYHPAPLRLVTIPKGDQVRKLYFLEPRDSVMIQAIINVIGPLFEAEFGEYSFGNRLNVGDRESHDVYRRWEDQYNSYVSAVSAFLNEGPNAWYLITDIENYYPSICLERLSGLVAAKVHDERTLAIVNSFLGLQAVNLDEQLESVEGLPAGVIYAHFLANVYLTEFDDLAVQHARGYARYVDDICLVCRNEGSLNATERLLREYLGRWSQDFKREKTERRSVNDWEPLIDHTRKMKYARRLDFVGVLDLPRQQIEAATDAEGLFRDLYLVVEEQGDVDRLVQDAGFVISQLRQLRAPDLDSVVYSLLETHPLRPSTFRVALSCLLRMELPNPSQRFRQYLARGRDDLGYSRMNLLQILPHFSESAGQLKELLIDEFAQDPNYLVRANTYVALKILAEREAISLSTDELRPLRERETSSYAALRLIDCYAAASGEVVWLSLLSCVTPDSAELVAAVTRAFCSLVGSKGMEPTMLESLLPSFECIEGLDVEGYIHLLYLTSRYGAFWMISHILGKAAEEIGEQLSNELFSIVALEVIEELAMQTQLGRLFQFSEFVNQSGLRTEAKLGFEEVISRTGDTELRHRARAHRDAVRQASVSVGLPEWYVNDPGSHRGLYRESRGDADYLCLKFLSEATNRAGTLELISMRRIEETGFSSIDRWVAYLRGLDTEGLISLIDAGAYTEDGSDKVFCLYEKPAGFSTLAEWLQHSNVEGLLPVSAVLELALCLVQKITEVEFDNVQLRSIDPLNVLWNPAEGSVMLLNIGASLGIPTYQCGIPGCSVPSSRDEIGPSTSTYHLGLLLLQLIRKECPLQAVNSTRSRYGDHPTVADLVDVPDISPHFRLILVRMLQKVPDYRYSDLSWLEHDLRDAIMFACSLSGLPATDGDAIAWSTLQDFITFRLKIISRNPEFRATPPVVRAHNMLEALSHSLALLPEPMLSNWEPLVRMWPQLPEFPSGVQARKLSPEGRRLLAIAEGWEEGRTLRGAGRHTATSLSKLCLYNALAIEASACLAAFLGPSSDVSAEAVAEMNQVILSLMGELRDNASATFTVRPAQQTSIAIQARFSRDDVQQLQEFLTWLRTDYSSPYGKRANSLKAVGLFLVLCGFDCELLRNHRLIARSRVFLDLNSAELRGRNLWQLVKDFAALDEEISHFEDTSLGEGGESERFYVWQAAEAWIRIPETIAFIQRLNASKRWAAELYSYDYWGGDGIVQLTFPHFGELSFRRLDIFLSGYPVKERDAKRPVRVDVLDDADNSTRKICSVLAPSEHFRELPFPSRRLSPARIASWMQKHRYQRALIFMTMGVGVAVCFLRFLGSILGITIPLLFHVIASLLGAVFPNLVAGSIQSVLATLYPEDAPLVE